MYHRRTSQGTGEGAAALLESGKAIIFPANTKFFRQKPVAKNEEKNFLYLLNEKKRNSFRLARWSARNQGFLLIIIGWGESDK